MIINKFKKKNCIELDDQTLFILRVAAQANAKRMTSAWGTIKEGAIVRQLVEEDLLPSDDRLYERVMYLITDARMRGEADDYRNELSAMFNFAKKSMNLNKWDIINMRDHMSRDTKAEDLVSLEFFDQFNQWTTVGEIADKLVEGWKKYQYCPEVYPLIDELIRIEYPENPVTLFDVMEWHTIVTIRPFAKADHLKV